MFTVAAVIPSPPLLVAPLGGTGDVRVDRLRSATLYLLAELARHGRNWIVIGVDEVDRTIGPDAFGTFRGFGADVRAGLSAEAGGEPDPDLPLAVLIAAAMRAAAAPDVRCSARLIAADTAPQRCAEVGRSLRAAIDADDRGHVLLVVADGANTLTEKAPGYFHPRARSTQQVLDDALATGDRGTLAGLAPDVCYAVGLSGRAAFQVLAAAFSGTPEVTECYRDAPFGVGYHVCLWREQRS